MLTAPIRISGSTIRASVDGGSGDGVRVGIYGDDVHSVENCDPIKGKQTDVTVTWKGSSALKLVNGGVSLVFQNPHLGGVIAAAMMTNIVTAGLAGAAVPLAFDRLNLDPAVASSIFVTMITDSMGFFASLGLATAARSVGPIEYRRRRHSTR